jgi:hypothetical protein
MSTFSVQFHPGQVAIHNSPARFKVVAAGRRFGKSHFAAYNLGIEALKTENERGYKLTPEHGVYYIAPTFDQAKRVMWPKLREILGYAAKGGLITKENTNDGWIELVSGRRIFIKGADNPDSLRGIALSYVVLDEYADMKEDVWSLIIRPALGDVEGEALFIGTPKGKNHFYKIFMGALEKPLPPDWDDSRPNPWDKWESFHFKTIDNPFLARDEIADMEADESMSREAVRQELEASFISGSGRHLKAEWFEVVDKLPSEEGQLVVTVDLAGYAKSDGKHKPRTDETVICTTLITSHGWYVVDMEHGYWDVREVALRIMRTTGKYPGCSLGVEKGALMNAVQPYLEDEMRRLNRYIMVNPLTHANTKKLDRIVWALQGRAQRGQIKLIHGGWNQHFLDQCSDLGDPLSHDDMPDALAYADQLASVNYIDLDTFEDTYFDVLDLEAGY